jgi:hypothetical protein
MRPLAPPPGDVRPDARPPKNSKMTMALSAVGLALVAGWFVFGRSSSDPVPPSVPAVTADKAAAEPSPPPAATTAPSRRPSPSETQNRVGSAPGSAAVKKTAQISRTRRRDTTRADEPGRETTQPSTDRSPPSTPPETEPPAAQINPPPPAASPPAEHEPRAAPSTPPAPPRSAAPAPIGHSPPSSAAVPPVPAPSLPRMFVSENSDRLARICRQVEAAVIEQAGVSPDFARNITAGLRKVVRPNTPIYPAAMYYFIAREAASKRDRSTASANLAAAQSSGRLSN